MENEVIKSYKGFDENLKCRDFQYEVGGEYETNGPIRACENGFHACEMPLDVFGYYPPGSSRYCEVEQSGDIDKRGEDSKVASSRIKIGAELGVPGLIKAQIEWTRDAVARSENKQEVGNWAKLAGGDDAKLAGGNDATLAGGNRATLAGGNRATLAGGNGATLAGGDWATLAGGNRAALAGGDWATLAGGDWATLAGGDWATLAGGNDATLAGGNRATLAGGNGATLAGGGTGSAGKNSAILCRGNGCKARGGIGSIIVLAEESKTSCDIVAWKAGIIDGETLKPDTWYTLKDGEFAEVEE